MSAKHQYIVPGCDNIFSSLEDAKWYIQSSFTRAEAIKYLTGEVIYHFIGDRLHSETPIKVNEFGNISFGKTYKI